MSRKLRILFSSNAPYSSSGYAQQMADLLPRLRKQGYEIGIVNFYGQEGGIFALDDIVMFPKMGDLWGTDAVVAHQRHFNPDCVITFQDVWVMDPGNTRQYKNWIPMVPVDHEPVPPAVFERLKMAYRVLTHTHFGHNELQKRGMHSTYIPLLVDTEVYKPSEKSKAELKKSMGIPEDIFLFGMVAANKDNPPRKSFQEAMDAFKMFHDVHPKSGMYFHTILNQQGGFPIDEYAKTLGIENCIYHCDPYEQLYRIKKPDMAQIYSAFDCLLAPSRNEGFGVPVIEAQSCGVPVIVNKTTAMPELVDPGVTGEICEYAYKYYTPLLSYVFVPDTNSLYKKMEKIFNADRKKMGDKAREFMLKNYDLDSHVKESWVPFLTKLEKELKVE